jgi:hypothetical protein
MHPLQCGLFRLKHRLDRRPGMPIEPFFSFYAKCVRDVVRKHVALARHWIRLAGMLRQARREQAVQPYVDLALMPVQDEETETLEMFTQKDAAKREVAHVRKVDALTHGAGRTVVAQRA